mgnify:CR=1 FL=1
MKLTYAHIIERDQRYRILADLGLRPQLAALPKLMPRLVDLVVPEHLELLAESRSILNEDGYWLAESDDARRKLIKGTYELHRYKGTPFGGYKTSGIGRETHKMMLAAYTQVKNIYISTREEREGLY